ARLEHEISLSAHLGPAGPGAVINSCPECVPLGAVHSRDHGPRTVIVWRRSAPGEPRAGEDRQRVIRLLMKEMRPEALADITFVVPGCEPRPGQGQVARQWANSRDDGA